MNEHESEEIEQVLHDNRQRKMVYALIASFITAAVLAVVVLFVSSVRTSDAVRLSEQRSNAAIVESQRKWCALLVPLDDTYKVTTPPTSTGKQFAAIIHRLRTDFGCK